MRTPLVQQRTADMNKNVRVRKEREMHKLFLEFFLFIILGWRQANLVACQTTSKKNYNTTKLLVRGRKEGRNYGRKERSVVKMFGSGRQEKTKGGKGGREIV